MTTNFHVMPMLTLCFCCAAWLGSLSAAWSAPPSTALGEKPRDELLADMAAIVERSLQKSDTDHPIFHGCIDWHSAVHGHWALLRVARTTGHFGRQAQWVHAALGPALVKKETAYLQEHPQFEMPYGRAWFLRLALEHDAWMTENRLAGPSSIAAMADQIADSLLQHYRRHAPSPASREYANASWALAQLHAFLSHRANAAGLAEVEELIDENFLTNDVKLRFADDSDPADFFSRFGNWTYLVAHTQPRETFAEFWAGRRPNDDELAPVTPRRGAPHHLGMNWCRLWALAAAGRALADPAEQARLRAAQARHIDAGIREFRQHGGDYRSYDHWVPQFAIYALSEPNQ